MYEGEVAKVAGTTLCLMVPAAETEAEKAAFAVAAALFATGYHDEAIVTAYVPFVAVSLYCLATGQFKRLLKRNAICASATLLAAAGVHVRSQSKLKG